MARPTFPTAAETRKKYVGDAEDLLWHSPRSVRRRDEVGAERVKEDCTQHADNCQSGDSRQGHDVRRLHAPCLPQFATDVGRHPWIDRGDHKDSQQRNRSGERERRPYTDAILVGRRDDLMVGVGVVRVVLRKHVESMEETTRSDHEGDDGSGEEPDYVQNEQGVLPPQDVAPAPKRHVESEQAADGPDQIGPSLGNS